VSSGGDFWQLELLAPQLRAVQRLCLGSHSLPVETGRFAKIDKQDRCCIFCESGALGNEKHLLGNVPRLGDRRCLAALLLPAGNKSAVNQLVATIDSMLPNSCLHAGGRWVSSAHLLSECHQQFAT